MRAWLALLAMLFCVGLPLSAKADNIWRIQRTEWTEADEKGFGDFIHAIAESGCSTTVECMRGPGNPYRAKWVYTLRAYYAWKNSLPFGYTNEIAGRGNDFRFNSAGNRITGRHDLIDRGSGLAAPAILAEIHDHVSSATYRTDAAQSGGVMPDFYAPKIQPGSIRAGTVLYDINGHVAIVYAVENDGRVLYMSADPDATVTRSVYGAQ